MKSSPLLQRFGGRICPSSPVRRFRFSAILIHSPAVLTQKISSGESPPHTKAVIVVHLGGMPAEMDTIMEIAKRHNIFVVEDCSHAHGATYKGKKVGTIGDVGCFSMQGGKLLPSGEGGVMITDNLEYYERAICLGHYERIRDLPEEKYRKYAKTCFGYKYRIAPISAAIARVQLRHLDEA